MGGPKLTRSEAVELITPIVDGEATEKEELSFFAYAKKDPSVLRLLEQERRMRDFLRTEYKCAAAPPRLRKWIENVNLDDEVNKKARFNYINDYRKANNTKDKVSVHPNPLFQLNQRAWVFTTLAAAIVLIVLYAFSLVQGPLESNNRILLANSATLSEQTYQHFVSFAGQQPTPTMATNRREVAMQWLSNNFNMRIEIPTIRNATFHGVLITEFTSGYRTPLLEYRTGDQNSIYLFVFNEQQLIGQEQIKRNPKAVNSCRSNSDYYVEDIDGKHVVSWKWNDTWYSAISNYDGHQLAARVKPLAQNF
jgi:hypothetical protein